MLSIHLQPFPRLSSERVILRKMEKEDASELFSLRSNKNVMRFLDRPLAVSVLEMIDFIQKINDSADKNEGITWGISMKEEPKLVGTIGYWRIVREHFRAEIGYLLHPDYQGKGIMQEAFDSVLQYGFKSMKLHSVEANVNPANKASIKLLERNHFTREAYFKENYYYEGKFLDSAIYSLVANVEMKQM